MKAYKSRRHIELSAESHKLLVELDDLVREFIIDAARMHGNKEHGRHKGIVVNFLGLEYGRQCSEKSHKEKIVSSEMELFLIGREAHSPDGKSAKSMELGAVHGTDPELSLDICGILSLLARLLSDLGKHSEVEVLG